MWKSDAEKISARKVQSKKANTTFADDYKINCDVSKDLNDVSSPVPEFPSPMNKSVLWSSKVHYAGIHFVTA